MVKSKEIIKQSISILMLVIYLFSSLSILSSHNHDDHSHNHDDHSHHHDLLICENFDVNFLNTLDCSHDSHIMVLEESCALCDYFSNCKPAIFDNMICTVSETFTEKKVQLFASLYLIDATNTQNKSPPFII